MAKWEYQIIVQRPVPTKKVYFEPTFEWEPAVDLSSYGEEGWELVSVASVGHGTEGRTSELRYYFKRSTN